MTLSGSLFSSSGFCESRGRDGGRNWTYESDGSKTQAVLHTRPTRKIASSRCGCPKVLMVARALYRVPKGWPNAIAAGAAGTGQDHLPQWVESLLRNISGLTRSHVQLLLKALEALQPLNVGKHQKPSRSCPTPQNNLKRLPSILGASKHAKDMTMSP